MICLSLTADYLSALVYYSTLSFPHLALATLDSCYISNTPDISSPQELCTGCFLP